MLSRYSQAVMRLPHSKGKVLIVDDEKDIRFLFAKKIQSLGYITDSAGSIEEALVLCKEFRYESILLDLFLEEGNSLDSIADFYALNPNTKIVILTGHGSIDFAVRAINKGATGFLLKTERPDAIVDKFRALVDQDVFDPLAEGTNLAELGIIGKSEAVKEMGCKLQKLRGVDSTVLLQGESGTGKEVFARAIHKISDRASAPFIAINCAAISESILESELFGYKKGAFTDAKSDRKGYFETCTNGTLFLDEIGEMPAILQSKLLRVLQEKEVTPLGSCTPVTINTRIIAATNRNLMDEVHAKRFRQDLFYRLAVFQIALPALRQRKSDIPVLVEHFIDKFNSKFTKEVVYPNEGIYSRLKAYDWPGNIRELQNAVERAVVLSEKGVFSADELLPHVELSHESLSEEESPRVSDLPLNFQDAKNSFEELYINNLLRVTYGNVTEAAKLANQYRPNIYRLINKHHIDPSQFKVH